MPVANNIFTGAILAPFVTILAAISLGAVQRAIEYVAFVAKNPQKGALKQLRPYAKHLDLLLERLLGGNKFSINTTNILLMGIIILLICLALEGGGSDKAKRVVVVDRKKPAAADEDDKKQN